MKQLLLLFFILNFALSAQAYDFSSGGIYYNITSASSPYTVAVTYETTACNSYSGNVTIPATVTNNSITYSVTTIGEYALGGSTGLTSVTFEGTNMTVIGKCAFDGCSSLASITIPGSVTSIGHYAFRNCYILKSITIPVSVTSIGLSVFYNCMNLQSIDILGPITTIGNSDFQYCSKLQSITIPNSVKSIGTQAFMSCDNLTSINLSDSVTSIESEAFSVCIRLTSVSIPGLVTSIGWSAFNNCSSLISLTIPGSVTSIGNNAFYDCRGLTTIIAKAVNPIDLSLISNVFANVSKTTCTLYVPAGSKNAYANASQWKDFTNIVEFSPLIAGTISTTGETVNIGNTPSLISSTTAASGGDGNITYKWQMDGFDIANSNSATYTPASSLATGTHTFTRWAKDGTYSTTFTQSGGSYVVTVTTVTNVTETVSENIKLYPNPCSGYFVVNAGKTTTGLRLYDITGRLVLTKLVNGETTVETDNLKAGLYTIIVNEKSYKLVKK